MSMNEFLLISAPGEKTCQHTWDKMNNVTSKQNNLSVNHKFHVPDLKVAIVHKCFLPSTSSINIVNNVI